MDHARLTGVPDRGVVVSVLLVLSLTALATDMVLVAATTK